MEINKVYQGDSVILMREIPNNFIDLTVTSPPYDELRDYKGYSFDFEGIARELFRITKEGGVVVWVVKDSVIEGNRSLNSYRQAIFFQKLGFKVYDVIIWSKINSSLPHAKRYFDTFEYMFVFSKGLPKIVNLLKDRKNKNAGGTTWGKRSVREKDGSLTDKGKKTIDEFSIRFNIWEYSVGFGATTRDKYAFEHPAMFPEELAKDHILSWSKEGDLVFDPFAGSGTTLKMAQRNNRNYLGFEIAEEYIPLINKRIAQNNITHFSNTLTSAEVNPAMQESLISVKRESADSPNSPHDSSTIKEEANFS